MSDHTFERAVRDWLEDGSDRTPPHAIDAVLLAVKTTRQERDLRVPWRITPMPTFMKLAAGVAVVAIAGWLGLSMLGGPPGPAASPSPSPAPTASPNPTQTDVTVGTITLTDTGCTWTGNPGVISAAKAPVIARLQVVNETDTFGNFGIYRLADGRTWDEAASWITAMNEEFHGGPPASAPTGDFTTEVGNVDAPERGAYPATLTLGAGVHGVVCSSNEPPPGLIFAVYLVGPLEIVGP